MGHVFIFAATFLPSFVLGRLSGDRFRSHLAGLLPDTFGGMIFFSAIVAFVALTVDGVVGGLVPDFLHQPLWFLSTGFGCGSFLAVLRGLFRDNPEPPPALYEYDRPGCIRPSSALPPVEFDARSNASRT